MNATSDSDPDSESKIKIEEEQEEEEEAPRMLVMNGIDANRITPGYVSKGTSFRTGDFDDERGDGRYEEAV